VSTSTSVLQIADDLRAALTQFDPRLLTGDAAARAAEELSATAKACTAASTLAAARAVECGAYKPSGAKDGASWWARHSGITPSQARQAFDTARSLEDLPDTKSALVAGDISLAQAMEIVQSEADTPGAELALLDTARQSDLSKLKEASREHRQAHADPAQLRDKQFRAREFRDWRDRDGMVCGRFSLPPEVGLPLIRRVETGALRARRAARAAGKPDERFEAYRADALAAIAADSKAGQSNIHADLVIVCDLFAWRRGHTHLGEVCHIIGGGPIPVEVAKELSQDAFLKAVLHDGVAIHTVSHPGRRYPAQLKTALDLGPVPDFTGRQCAECGQRWGLQSDHIDPVAHDGPTEYTNLQPLCWTCHQTKTEADRRAGLLGAAAQARDRPPPRDTS
jgi:hypothetical protein